MKRSKKAVAIYISVAVIIASIAITVVLFGVILHSETPKKLVFAEVKDNCFELKRIDINDEKIELISAGILEVNESDVIPQIETPLFPWESSNDMEYTAQVWGALPVVLGMTAANNEKALGVVEYFNLYYLVTESKNQQYLYRLTFTELKKEYTAVKLKVFMEAIRQYHGNESNKLASGGTGLQY